MLLSDQLTSANSVGFPSVCKLRSKNWKGNKIIQVNYFASPVGRIFSAADENYVYIVLFEECPTLEKKFMDICRKLDVHLVVETKTRILKHLEHEVTAYFDGTLQKFTVPMKTIGTQFHQAVWSKLQDLPYGSTHSYSELAKTMGCPVSHARAVGNACGNNVLLFLIPCHRVVAITSRGGYNSGADRKQWLINHEKIQTEL